ncbi:rhomboid family [Pyrenophora seminiperda CCB06]|uniref:Rhomboid family n=1 Tax=Pyrenophora seminiperda CCB06 TaxID=1302712 RepID=A0A3M7M7N1_9PLEO|nr:rhomboid family [Pyrenophora seminiperda CCB06]
MSSYLRLTATLRSPRTLGLPRPTNIMSSHFFHKPTPFSLPSSRFYFRGRTNTNYQARETANTAVLYTLLGTNLAVFGYAMYLKEQARQGHPLPFKEFTQKMTLSLPDFQHGSYLPILTSTFTHLDIGHLLANMFSLYFLGSFLASAPVITPLRYFTIAIGSGLAGSVGWLFHRYYQRQAKAPGKWHTARGSGFSGSIMGLSTVAACLTPHARFFLMGIVPMPLWALVTGFAVFDGYYLNSLDSNIGHAGHLGGLAFGLLYYVARLRTFRY